MIGCVGSLLPDHKINSSWDEGGWRSSTDDAMASTVGSAQLSWGCLPYVTAATRMVQVLFPKSGGSNKKRKSVRVPVSHT